MLCVQKYYVVFQGLDRESWLESWGEQWIFFPSNLNHYYYVSLDFIWGNTEILVEKKIQVPQGTSYEQGIYYIPKEVGQTCGKQILTFIHLTNDMQH